MNVNLTKRRKDSNQTSHISTSYLNDRIGCWASVIAVHSESNSVDILTDTGYSCINIPVVSKEWICNDGDKSFISGSRNLPPVKSRVFVLMPYHTMDGAFVLCSGYTKGDEGTHNLWAKTKNDINKLNYITEKISLSGWKYKEYEKDGNKVIESLDEKIKIELVLADNSADSLVKGINIESWDNSIKITPDGFSIEDKNGNKLETKSSGIEITDKNGNKIESTTNSLKINGNLEVLQ